jgi:DNA polymerase III subunit alpha
VKIKVLRTPSSWWNLHTHSRYSSNDALPEVADMVEHVKQMGQPALGLTDHGNMAGSVELYAACKKAGIKPFPGTELYTVFDKGDKKAKRHHMCVVAYTTEGYQNLVNLSSLSAKNFYHKPLIDLTDLAQLAEDGRLKGLAGTSGCFSGMAIQSIINDNSVAAEVILSSLGSWFDKFYVELQDHGNELAEGWTDRRISDALIEMADKLGLPCVITQDSHYINKEDRHDHESLKRLVSWGPDPDDGVFSGDGYHLADEQWIRDHHPEATVRRGLEGLGDLLGDHDLSIPELDNYHYNVPFTAADPEKELREHCERELQHRNLPRKYQDLLQEELDVIEFARMAGYLLVIKEITDWCRKEDIFFQTRGSASGSLVCFLLGITQVDPIEWGLRYERFVSRDRTKPPDVDLDVEHVERARLIEWLGERFNVAQIGTYTTYSLGGEDKGSKGSLRVKYFARKRAMNAEIKSWEEVPEEDKKNLYRLTEMKLISNTGVHPAGIVLTTTEEDINRLVPIMYAASSGTFTTQYHGKNMEKLGFLKVDILGVKTLTVLKKARKNLGKPDLDWIPLNDRATFGQIRQGKTEGVFQLEGPAATRGVRRLKPTKINDVIAAMAIFRPAALKTGATERFLDRKSGLEPMPDRHPILAKVTSKTQGIMIYQEQVIEILRDLGMDPEPLTEFLSAVKASNKETSGAQKIIDESRPVIRQLCLDKGFSEDEFVALWHDIEGFGEYGFNQAHSTVYGLTAYKCAYLATNHPVEFFAALLNVAAGNQEKEPRYLRAARNHEVRVRPAHVNTSGLSYEVDKKRNCVRKGFLAIKGVGKKAADSIIEVRPEEGFNDLDQFCSLVNHRKVTGIKPYKTEKDTTVGTFGALYEARAFEGME